MCKGRSLLAPLRTETICIIRYSLFSLPVLGHSVLLVAHNQSFGSSLRSVILTRYPAHLPDCGLDLQSRYRIWPLLIPFGYCLHPDNSRATPLFSCYRPCVCFCDATRMALLKNWSWITHILSLISLSSGERLYEACCSLSLLPLRPPFFSSLNGNQWPHYFLDYVYLLSTLGLLRTSSQSTVNTWLATV